MQNKINNIIFNILKDLAQDLENENLENPTEQTKLYGEDGELDSLALVSLISDLEDSIGDEFGVDLILANEKTMSQRNSPFKDVKSLSEYISSQIEQNHAN